MTIGATETTRDGDAAGRLLGRTRDEREASAKARTGSDLKREAKWRIVERRKEKKKGRRSERGKKNGRG